MIPPELATGIAVFIAGLTAGALTYEYSAWRTQHKFQKYLPLIANILQKQGGEKRPDDYP